MENREEPVMGYPAPAGFLRLPAIYNAPRRARAHPPAATTITPAAITRAANPSLAKPVDGSQVQPVGRGVKACGWVLLFICVGVFAWACVIAYLTPKFKISSLSVSPFNSSSSILKANWNITFSVRNRNYFGETSYERVQVSVLYHGVPLSTASVAPFYQNGLRWRSLEANMEALSSPSADNDLVSSIDRDLQDGAVNFTVAVAGSFKYNNLLSQEGEEYRRPMTVSCDNVMVGLSDNKTAVGALVGGWRKCKVDINYYVYA